MSGAGTLVGGALVGHVPTLMVDESVRRRLGGGEDTTLVAGFGALRQRLDEAGTEAIVLVDTHWFTTAEHIVAGQAHHRGTYTSEELPIVIRELAFDYPGAPELAERVQAIGRAAGHRVLNATSDAIAHHYPTLNVVHHLRWDRPVLSTGICQTADDLDFLAFGAVIAEAVTAGDERVAVIASGGLSHRFWPLREFLDHSGFSPDHVRTPEARAFDERMIELMLAGRHADVIDAWPEYAPFSPEGKFGHYLTMAGALGGRDWTDRGEQLSAYESSYGTGQVHVWFPHAPTGPTTHPTTHPTTRPTKETP
jgi:3,4-dihydroxyphenylacetate 2,3-dioxygenase